MSKQVGIEINIQGSKDVLELQKRLREIRQELKETNEIEAYDNLTRELVEVQANLRDARIAQRQAIDEFRSTSEATGAYDRLNAQLRVSRRELKDLAADGKENTDEFKELSAEVQELDRRLKDIDASAGQFQRNVGNYTNSLNDAIKANSVFFRQVDEGFESISNQVGFAAKAITGAFVAFQAGSIIIDLIGDLQQFVDELVEVQRQVQITFGVTGEELDELTAKVSASARVFETDFNTTLRASNQLVVQFGVDASESIDLVNQALAASADQAQTLGLIESELSKLTGLGIEADSALALLVEASNRGFNVDVISEPLVALREQSEATVTALEQAFGQERTQEIFATFQTAPLEAIQEISDAFAELEPSSREAGAVLADVFKSAGEDNVQLTRSLGELNLSLESLVENGGEAAQKQLELAEANEELSRAQLQVANQLAPINDQFKILTAQIGTFLLRAISAVLTVISSFVSVVNSAATGISNLITTSSTLGPIFDSIATAVNIASEAFETFRQNVSGIQDDFARVAEAGRRRAEQLRSQLEEEQKLEEEAAQQRVELDLKTAKRRREEAQKARQQFLQDEREFIQKRRLLLLQLEQQATRAQIQAIEDPQQQALAIERQGFIERQAQREKEFNEFVALQNQQEQAILNKFGENSERFVDFQNQSQEDIRIARQQFDKLRIIDEQQTDARIAKINRDFAGQQITKQQNELKQRLSDLENASQIELLQLEQFQAQRLISQEEAARRETELRRRIISEQLGVLENEQKELEIRSQLGFDVTQEQFDNILLLRQQLNTELARLEQENTQNVQEETQKREQTREQEFQNLLSSAQTGLTIVNDFSQALDDRQTERLQEREAEQQNRINELKEEIENAAGIEREFLQQRLEEETKVADQIAESRVQAERNAAIQEKAIAITQSIINTALAITKALPNPAAVAAAAVIGAAQTAIIAAQPLATGGIVGKNIKGQPIRRSNGDDTLTTLKTGEVVLNKTQQRRLGGAKTFRAIGVPGFATGGIVSAPLSAPSIEQADVEAAQVSQLLLETQALAVANSGRIDRITVLYTTDTQDAVESDQEDRIKIENVATL